MTQKHLPDWFRAAGIDPRNEPLEARNKANDQFAAAVDCSSALHLVRLAYQQPADEQTSLRFAEKHREHDAAFPLRDNTRLLAILAGAAIMEILQQSSDLSVFTGYLVESTMPLGWQPLVSDVPSQATSRLAQLSDTARRVDISLPTPQTFAIWNTDVAKALKGTPARGDTPGTPADQAKAIELIATYSGAAIDGLAKTITDLEQALQRSLGVLEEQNSMLWWLLSGGTAGGTDASSSTVAITAAWELAAITKFLPGPRQAPQILAQLVNFATAGQSTNITVAAAVSGLPGDSKPPPLVEALVDFAPIISAIHGRPAGPSVDDECSCIELARRAYAESMLMRAYGKVQH